MKKTAVSEEKSKAETVTLSNQKNTGHPSDHKPSFQQTAAPSYGATPQAKRWNPCDFYYY